MSQLADDPTPEQAVDEWLSVRAMQRAESTIRNDTSRLDAFTTWCDEEGVDDLTELTGRHLHAFVNWRRDDLADITLQKQLSTIREFLRWASDMEFVAEGLAETVHSPELPDGAESRDIHLTREQADAALEYLDTHHYASHQHVCLALLWRTGMRLGALRSLDLDDLHEDEEALELVHRPETETPLKNDGDGERWVYVGRKLMNMIGAYVAGPRHDVTDEYGRDPLITTRYGRPAGGTIYNWINGATRPCWQGRGCPHDRDPQTAECARSNDSAQDCPDSRSPHGVRRGAITAHLLNDVPPEVVSERMDVSLEVLYRHYDARKPDEKMNQRRRYLE
jgi:site-specific recombinase XerD